MSLKGICRPEQVIFSEMLSDKLQSNREVVDRSARNGQGRMTAHHPYSDKQENRVTGG